MKDVAHATCLPKDVEDVLPFVKKRHNPIHSVCVQHGDITSVFAGSGVFVPSFIDARDRGEGLKTSAVPDGPPISPLTRSYFTTWAFLTCSWPDNRYDGNALLISMTSWTWTPTMIKLHP